MKNEKFSWKARGRSFKYAFRGIRRLVADEHNSRIHVVVAVAVIVVGFIFGLCRWEWCAVLLCIGGVLMAEAFNSGIEALADKVSPGFDPLIGKAKDVAAAGVLMFVVIAVAVGVIVFLPHLIALFL